MPVPTQPLDLAGSSLREDVVALLQRELVTGVLPPGARLSDAELVTRTGTSRAPLREALNQLAGVGLVVVRPRQSTFVTELDATATGEACTVDGEVLRQALREVVPVLSAGDRDALSTARRTVLASDRAVRDGLRTRTVRGVLDVVLAAAGNPEYTRISAAAAPVLDRHLALRADRLDTASGAALRETVDAALDGAADSADAAWGRYVATVLADPALAGPGARATADGPDRVPAPTLRDRAAEEIARAVLDGTLLPGEVIRESELMRWLGVSRTPVREALTTLARQGIVEQHHHRPARVAQPDERGLRDLMRATGVLRRLALRLALARDPRGLAQALAVTLPAWSDVTSDAAFAAAGNATAQVLTDRCGNDRLVALTQPLVARGLWAAAHHPAVRLAATEASTRRLVVAVAEGRGQDAEAEIWRSYSLVPA